MNEAGHQRQDQKLYDECLKKAEGDESRALVYYNHRKGTEIDSNREDLDQREKWPMLTPLLVLYTLGTMGVIVLVYWYLANRLGW